MEKKRKLLSIGIYRAPASATVPRRYVPAGTEHLQLLVGGRVCYRGADETEEREYGKGTFFWFREGELTVNRTFAEDPMRLLVIRFHCPPGVTPRPGVVNFWNDHAIFDDFCNEIFRVYHTPDCDLAALGDYIVSTLRWKSQLYSEENRQIHYPSALRNALIYIHNKYKTPIRTEEIARQAKVSKPYLFMLFARHVGDSPHRYVNEVRLKKAAEMLCTSLLSVKEISEQCGFATPAVFYRRFREYYGLTPAAYRAKFDPLSF